MRPPKPSPIRFILDAVPLIALAICWISFLVIGILDAPHNWDWLTVLIFVYVFISPLATGMWTLIRMTGQVQSLCARNRREELSLTMLGPRIWLRSQLRRRLIGLLAVPALNLVILFPILILWAVAAIIKASSIEPLGPLLFATYIMGAIHICAIGATLMGVFQMIQRTCTSPRSDASVIAVCFKWIAILFLAPWLVILVCVATLGVGFLVLPWGMAIVYIDNAKTYWNDAAESYYKFEDERG